MTYPLDTFSGETKKEIEALIKQAKTEERQRVIGVLEMHIGNFSEFGATRECILNRLTGVLNRLKGQDEKTR